MTQPEPPSAPEVQLRDAPEFAGPDGGTSASTGPERHETTSDTQGGGNSVASTFPLQRPTPHTGPAMIVCHEAAKRLQLARWTEEVGVQAVETPEFEQAVSTVLRAPTDWHALVVHLDDGLDRKIVLETLRALRVSCPQLTIVLMCVQQPHNVFGLEQLSLCDVKLKLPVSRRAFQNAVTQCRVNNRFHRAEQGFVEA